MPLSRAICISLALFVVATCARGAGPVDLGQGLNYVRVHSLVADETAVTAALTANNALVLDLRYPAAAQENSEAFLRALAKHTGPAPLFILVSPATPVALAESLTASSVKYISLGVRGSVPTAQVLVVQTADADRRAYDALESGLPLADLLSGKIDKSRYDEASLMNDFRNGNTEAQPPTPPDPNAKKDDDAKKAPVLTDRVLQRAVNLYSALQAIKSR
jgi:hypothetical protein